MKSCAPKKFTVLIGVASDPVLQHIAQACHAQYSDLLWLDQNDMGKTLFVDSVGWHHRAAGWYLAHDQIAVVYNRLAGLPKQGVSAAQRCIFELLLYLLDEVYVCVLNRPKFALSNFAKLTQLQTIELGVLQLPNSRVLQSLPNFSENWIMKSLSHERSIVYTTKSHTGPLMGAEPVLFQSRIIGDNVRVHVLFDQCFSVKIKTQSVDYRYTKTREFIAIEMPDIIKKSCINVAQQLKLNFCGIDLIISHSDWFILEVNPAPGFQFFEQYLAQKPLTSALINFFKKHTEVISC